MLTFSAENAKKAWDWLKTRGGIAKWNSANLSNPGASWSSPALTDGTPTTKPNWQAENKPSEIVTDLAQVEVSVDKEVKRFHVAVRRGSQGFSFKLTDASSAKVRREVEKAGEGAFYVFDYESEKNCVIMAPERTVPLSTWAMEQGWK